MKWQFLVKDTVQIYSHFLVNESVLAVTCKHIMHSSSILLVAGLTLGWENCLIMALWQEHGSGPHVPIVPKLVQMPVRVTSQGFILQQQLFSSFCFSNVFLCLVLLFNKISVLSHYVMQCILPLDKNKVRRETEKVDEVDASWYCVVCVHWSCLQTSVKCSSWALEVERETLPIYFVNVSHKALLFLTLQLLVLF